MEKIKLIFVILFVAVGLILPESESNNRVKRTRFRHEFNDSVGTTSHKLELGKRSCDNDQIEYRLTKLEVQVAERVETLRSELKEGNTRLQALEWQNSEVQTALESLRNELVRFIDNSNPSQSHATDHFEEQQKQELKIDNLAKGIQLTIATLKILNNDMTFMKRNISKIENQTEIFLQNFDDLVTKQFLSNSLVDVKHHQVYQSHSPMCSLSNKSKAILPRNCQEVQERGNSESGIYRIQPEQSPESFLVLCDLSTREGGWTFIHNRYEGSQDFYLNWHNYKHGFGNLGGEFWLGLEHIHQLTGYEINELLVELVDLNLEKVYAHYSAFSIGNEVEGYSLKVLGGYNGDAGDSLIYHAGSKFSTKDMDQDQWQEGSCAQAHNGAWWYRGCDTCNLNGKYLNGDLPEHYIYHGMYWTDFRGPQHSLMQARMMVRPRTEQSPPIFPDGILGNGKV